MKPYEAPDAKIVEEDELRVYHVMSRVALEGYPLGDVEKECLFETIRRLSSAYFSEVRDLCLMGNISRSW